MFQTTTFSHIFGLLAGSGLGAQQLDQVTLRSTFG